MVGEGAGVCGVVNVSPLDGTDDNAYYDGDTVYAGAGSGEGMAESPMSEMGAVFDEVDGWETVWGVSGESDEKGRLQVKSAISRVSPVRTMNEMLPHMSVIIFIVARMLSTLPMSIRRVPMMPRARRNPSGGFFGEVGC